MRPPIRRNRRTQQALAGLSVVGALGAATALDLSTQTASAGSDSGSTTTRAHARSGSSGSGGRLARDLRPAADSPTKSPRQSSPTTQQAQPQPAPSDGGAPQATTSGS
ncbi:MAG: hypothetical protein ACR2K3_03535 [Nocardioides sp.]